MSSASWFSWILHQSLPYFNDRLPADHFEGYSKFVQIVRLCSRKRLSPQEVDTIETLVEEFIDYFEEKLYKFDYKRLKLWKPVVHQMLHIAGAIRRFGPMYLYAQWTVERYHQRIKPSLLKGKSAPNEHLANVICDWQCLNSLAFVLPLVGGIAGVNLNTLEGDIYTDVAGNLQISKLWKQAMLHDDEKVADILEGNDDDFEDLDVEEFVRADRAWYPHDIDVILPPRRRHPPLPLPRAGSGSEDSSSPSDTDEEGAAAEGDEFAAITTDRVLKHRILTGEFAEITNRDLGNIVSTLRDWDWLSEEMGARSTARQKDIVANELSAKKWKTMMMVRGFTGLAFMAPIVSVRITGTESPHWARTRSNAWIYYRGPDGSKRYGEVLYFLSAHDPRQWPFHAQSVNDDIPEDIPDIHLAVLKRYFPSRSRCLLRITNNNPRTRSEVIETEAIEDEVGLVQVGTYRYITTRSGGSFIDDNE